jgi:hypothetical protein
MREHVHGLNLGHSVLFVQQLQVAGLCGRVTGYIDDALGACIQNGLDDVGMHAGSWRVCDNDIRPTVFTNEVVCQDIFHVTGIE